MAEETGPHIVMETIQERTLPTCRRLRQRATDRQDEAACAAARTSAIVQRRSVAMLRKPMLCDPLPQAGRAVEGAYAAVAWLVVLRNRRVPRRPFNPIRPLPRCSGSFIV
jgi:hypothetical protein